MLVQIVGVSLIFIIRRCIYISINMYVINNLLVLTLVVKKKNLFEKLLTNVILTNISYMLVRIGFYP